jgi:chromosome segregation ATPase
MNIVEYFVRANLRRKIASRREGIHDIDERVAEIGAQLETWAPKVNGASHQPEWLVDKIANLRSERAKLFVRKPRVEQDIVTLERELAEEYRKSRSV